MRITVMADMAKSLPPPRPDPDFPDMPAVDLAGQTTAQLERLKWFLWHGNVFRALQTIGIIMFYLDIDHPQPAQAKLIKAIGEFDSYIRTNAGRIPNYGERRRAGEAISTAFTESTVNQVISKRMVEKQQMRWTTRGAHLLLQIRTRVLNDQLADDFHRWHPSFSRAPELQRRPHSFPQKVPLSCQSPRIRSAQCHPTTEGCIPWRKVSKRRR